jgi:hypothetical protein
VLRVMETMQGTVFDFEVAASSRTARARWRAPLGSHLRDGDVVEVRGPVDKNGILDVRTVKWSRPTAGGPSPR